METFERIPNIDVRSCLEKIEGVSNVQKVELDAEYLAWAEENLSEFYTAITENYNELDVYKFTYPSEGLSIAGYLWTPKKIQGRHPLTVWNRGGSQKFGSIGELKGTAFLDIPCDLVKQNMVVIGSEYRGGVGSEGNDEWGGRDLDDVKRIKEIADQLPFVQSDKAIVAGASRGGMMSYLLAAQEPWVKAVISLSGTADITALAEERPEMNELFVECFGGSETEREKRSATHFYPAIPKDLPLLIMHGSSDRRVSVAQARNLHTLLRESGHTVEYHEFPNAGHIFYAVGSPVRNEALEIIEKFVKKQL